VRTGLCAVTNHLTRQRFCARRGGRGGRRAGAAGKRRGGEQREGGCGSRSLIHLRISLVSSFCNESSMMP
jgi:hypothetical protein